MDITQTHQLYIVKWNVDGIIRLARFVDVLHEVKPDDRLEVEIATSSKDEASNPLWQQNCIIWWAPDQHFWYEATQDDELSKREYQKVISRIKNFPDINEDDPKSSGTLIKSYVDPRFAVVDGNMRLSTLN